MIFSTCTKNGLRAFQNIEQDPLAISFAKDALDAIVLGSSYKGMSHNASIASWLGTDPLSEKNAIAKSIHHSLIALFLECARHDAEPERVMSVLEEHGVSLSRRTHVVEKLYQPCRLTLRTLLSRTASLRPRIVDVQWRLEYHTKGSGAEQVNEPIYEVTLLTESSEGRKSTCFTASLQGLQTFVAQLQDAHQQLERSIPLPVSSNRRRR